MSYDDNTLSKIYSRTDGRCHICGKKLSFTNYSQFGCKGAWEVEHSRPKANGGGDHGNNLFAACISCNRRKGSTSTKAARAWYGRTRAPLSKTKRNETKQSNAVAGGLLGPFVGALAGPFGAIIGAAVGGKLGFDADTD